MKPDISEILIEKGWFGEDRGDYSYISKNNRIYKVKDYNTLTITEWEIKNNKVIPASKTVRGELLELGFVFGGKNK